MNNYIFGAKATAVGLYRALSILEPQKRINAFIVSKAGSNPSDIFGCPVLLLDKIATELTEDEKRDAVVYVAVPELAHEEIRKLLSDTGFYNLKMLDAKQEAFLMERYYTRKGIFPSLHSLSDKNDGQNCSLPKIQIYAASFYKDTLLANPPIYPPYIRRLYLGCAKARELGMNISGKADFYDDTGDNISAKNPNRCEMTAHYWIWKNRLSTDDEYVGVFHYRRMLDICEDDCLRIRSNDVDVILPYPMIHYPDIRIHHTWYVPESDWDTMRKALRELYPEYDRRFDAIFEQPYFYNYNMLVAKKGVFANYCAWLYPLLDRIEETSKPKGEERADRYTAYLSESLTTLYFMYHQNDLKIYHTGRLLFT